MWAFVIIVLCASRVAVIQTFKTQEQRSLGSENDITNEKVPVASALPVKGPSDPTVDPVPNQNWVRWGKDKSTNPNNIFPTLINVSTPLIHIKCCL